MKKFDTLRYIEKLKAAGVPEPQAKVRVEALATALGESASDVLAKKDDITSIKIKLGDIRSELKLAKWIIVTVVAGVVSLVAKAFL